jgi:hypothetical protein
MNIRTLPLIFVFATALAACDADLAPDLCPPPPRGTPWTPDVVTPGDATWPAGDKIADLGGWTSIPYCPPGDTPGSPVPEPGTAAGVIIGGGLLSFSLLRAKRQKMETYIVRQGTRVLTPEPVSLGEAHRIADAAYCESSATALEVEIEPCSPTLQS